LRATPRPHPGTLFSAILWGVCLASAFATSAEVFTGTTSTVVVEVPVEVTLDGQPLRELTRENFEVYDRGKKQELVGFDVIDLATVEGRPGLPPGMDLPIVARRHFLFLFDLSFSSPETIERARTAAREVVAQNLHPADLVAVGLYAQSRGAEMVLGFTTDRRQIDLALEALEASHLFERRADPLKLSFAADLGVGEASAPGGGGGTVTLGGSTAVADPRGTGIVEQLEILSERARQGLYDEGRGDVAALSGSLRDLALGMRKLDGRKHVVYFSEGFDDTLMRGATDDRRRRDLNQATATGEYWRAQSDEIFGSGELVGAFSEVVGEFRRADCTIHSVDIGGLQAERARGGRGVGNDGLFYLADGTGGELYERTNDLGRSMRSMLEKTSVTYLLAFQPRDLELDGDYHKIRVKLVDAPRRARLNHRPGYFAPDPEAKPTALERRLSLAQQLLAGNEGGAIETAALAFPSPPSREADDTDSKPPGSASVLVEVDGPTLVDGTPASELRIEFYVYAMDMGGGIADFLSQSLTLDLARAGEQLRRGGLKYLVPLDLPSGRYALRILVHNPLSGRSALRIATVEVPGEPAAAALLPPIFPAEIEEWLLVRGARPELRDPANPFFFGPRAFIPALRPELGAGDRVPLVLWGRGLARSDTAVGLQILDREGTVLHQLEVGPGLATAGHDGFDRALVSFDTSTLAPGDYRLAARLEDSAGETLATETAFRVVASGEKVSRLLEIEIPGIDEGAERLATVTTSATSTTSAASTTRAARATRPPEASPSERGFDRAYRELLGRASALERRALAAEVAGLVISTFGDRPERLGRLGRVEIGLAQDLADQDPEALVPVLLLHHDLVLEYKRRSRPYLALHAIQTLRQLADGYHRAAGSPGSRVVAAGLLSSLGGHLQAAGSSTALELFEHALQLQKGNEASLLGLAAYYEKRGGPYEIALGYLERLYKAHPDNREGRLRLAVNLLRLERDDEGSEHLAALLEGGEADWITRLAAQELAREHSRDGRFDAAIAVLRAALEKSGTDQKLQIQLAYMLDRESEPSASRRLIEEVTGAEPAGPPARGRYNQWPRRALDENRRALFEMCENRRGLLEDILEPAAEENVR